MNSFLELENKTTKTKKIASLSALLLMTTLFDHLSVTSGDQWEYNLTHKILEGYDNSIRPSQHHNLTLNVTFGLSLTQIIDVDERNMIITTNCWLNQNWIDNKLTWDPEAYDGIEFIHIPAEKIWKPDILLSNNADIWSKMSAVSTNTIVRHDGNVTWLSQVIFKSSCTINVRYFPFDEQYCDMLFASWTFDGFFLDINVNTETGDTTNYIKNGEWHLVNLTATKNIKIYSCCEEPYPEIIYQFHIRRRPLYYVFNMVFPCVLITLVAFLGFLMPPECSEKVSIGITTLLSITVFLMLVAESMPPTSEQLPLLGIYYAVTIGIVSLSTSFAVATLNINHKGSKGKRVPKIIKIIFIDYLANLLGTELSTSIKNRTRRHTEKAAIKREMLITNKNRHEYNTSILTTPSPIVNKKIIKSNSNSLFRYAQKKNHSKNYSLQILNSHISNKNSTDFNLNNDLEKYMVKNDSEFMAYIDREDSFSENVFFELDERTNKGFVATGPNKKSKEAPLCKIDSCMCDCVSINENGRVNSLKQQSNSKQNQKSFGQTRLTACSICDICSPKDNQMNKQQQQFIRERSNSKQSKKIAKEFVVEIRKVLEGQFDAIIKVLTRNIENSEQRIMEAEKLQEVKEEWSDVAKVADHFLLYFFPSLTLFTCFFIFYNSPHALGWLD